MSIKMWTKPETQDVIKNLRKSGYKVLKGAMGYNIVDEETNKVWKHEGRDLFRALPGTRGYLVSYHPDLFSGM
jgi:hypothetical protein